MKNASRTAPAPHNTPAAAPSTTQLAPAPQKPPEKYWDWKKTFKTAFCFTGIPLLAGIATSVCKGMMYSFWSILLIIAHGVPTPYNEKTSPQYHKEIVNFLTKQQEKPFLPFHYAVELISDVTAFALSVIPSENVKKAAGFIGDLGDKYQDNVAKKDVGILAPFLAGLNFTTDGVKSFIGSTPNLLDRKNPLLSNKKTDLEKAREAEENRARQDKKRAENKAREDKAREDKENAENKAREEEKARKNRGDTSSSLQPISSEALMSQAEKDRRENTPAGESMPRGC